MVWFPSRNAFEIRTQPAIAEVANKSAEDLSLSSHLIDPYCILRTLYDIQVTSLSPTPTMYSDLLDVLGNQGSSSITRSGSDSDNHVAVSFKAGKMKMELQEVRKIELAQAEQGIHSLTPSLVSIVFVFFYSFIYSCFCCLRNRCYLN